ncbi:MAG: long-chain fatty acid--CoA ligase [Desulfobacterium sp.]|nr:long-chain fatty acid--CoA ligase [Desulfobacterium sp.]
MKTDIDPYALKPWLAHYDNGVPETVNYEKRTLPEFLDQSAKERPNAMALSFMGYELTYKNLSAMVDAFAATLLAMGIKKGDRVAILLPNVIPCVVSYYGVLKIGAVAVMNNPLYSDRELRHQFNDANAILLITLDLLADRMVALRGETSIRKIIYTSIGDYLPFPKNLLFPLVAKKQKLAAKVTKAEGLLPWKPLIKQAPQLAKQPKIAFDDTAMLQYTGGTTGLSKGAELTHANLSMQIQQLNAWLPEIDSPDEIMLGALPFFHVMGLTVAMNFPIFRGWGNILVPKPQPEQLLEAITRFRPTLAPLVPTMYIGLLNHPKIESCDLTAIKVCISGSAPLPQEIITQFEEKTGSTIIEAFGMTESSPATHVNPFGKGKRKIGSIGVPLPDTECRIANLNDRNLTMPANEPGELVVRGPQVMRGYWNMAEETQATLENGWLYTGDIAMMDDDGYFFIVDRIKDMIISGGYNVYPRDIDEVLFQHPEVVEACAVGIPHEIRGEQIKAFVVLKQDAQATKKEIIDFCKTRLAVYKLPTQVEFRDSLPKTNVGKVLRKDLRQEELERLSTPNK